MNMRWGLLVGVCVVTAAVGTVAVFQYLPSARIVVTPTTSERSVTQAITLASTVTEPDFKRYVLPAKVVRHEVTERVTVQREGGAVREEQARGKIRLYNKQDDEQPLLPQTHLRHEATGVFFLTDQAVRIPPQGDVEVAVTAKEAGKRGNVPAGRFVVDKLPASLQRVVYGESEAAFTGGEVFDTPLAEAELEAALAQVEQKARERARGELTTQTGGAALREDLVNLSVHERRATAAVGSRATTFEAIARVEVRAFQVNENDLLSLTLLALRNEKRENEEFVAYTPESFQVEFLRADFERGEARINGHLRGEFAQSLPSTALAANNLAGRTEAEVQDYFQKIDGVKQVEVSLSPFWVTTVPARAAAVAIEVADPQSAS